MRVLCVAAHPDDEVLGPGGTLERHRRQGDDVVEVVVYECRVADARPGVHWWRWQSGSAYFKGELEEIVKSGFDIVYTHHAGDLNADHRAVHEAVMVACRPYAAPSVKSIRTFYTPSSTEWGGGFAPNLYVDISATITEKVKALGFYSAEMRPPPHPRSVEQMWSIAQFWGGHAAMELAEPFMVIRDRW